MKSAVIGLLACGVLSLGSGDKAERLADTYEKEVDRLNRTHAKRPKGTEEELRDQLSSKAKRALENLLALKASPEVSTALARAGEVALELDRSEDFQRVRARLAVDAPELAAELGVALSRPRYLLRGLGGLDEGYLEGFAPVLDAVLAGYDATFGFEELSKVPGKKLRVRLTLVDRVTEPPFFDPSPPYHSEIVLPVVHSEGFRSPTENGKFLFYGLCHELGHVVAMWGDPKRETDKHAWAHYTGVVVCQYVTENNEGAPFLEQILDARWRSYDLFAEQLRDVQPGLLSREAVGATLIELHEAVGPRAIGDAVDRLDGKDERLRVNRVRYYEFSDLREALLEVVEERAARERVEELLGG